MKNISLSLCAALLANGTLVIGAENESPNNDRHLPTITTQTQTQTEKDMVCTIEYFNSTGVNPVLTYCNSWTPQAFATDYAKATLNADGDVTRMPTHKILRALLLTDKAIPNANGDVTRMLADDAAPMRLTTEDTTTPMSLPVEPMD
ncbi:MAG: hypothetical protein WCN27_01000 [Alphaproteobacteria bacterium]